MYRKPPARNARSAGVKVKHVLKISVLLGACFLLVCHFKHSHEKTKEFDEMEPKLVAKAQTDDVTPNLGRKDLPYVQQGSKSDKLEEAEVENRQIGQQEEGKKEEASKRNVVVLQEETKHEFDLNRGEDSSSKEAENNGTDAGYKIDEHHREKATAEEADRSLGFMEKGTQKGESESSTSSQSNNGEDRNIRWAREGHYSVDDASSAVALDTGTVAERLQEENFSDDLRTNTLEQESHPKSAEESNGSLFIMTASNETDQGSGSSNSDKGSLPNATEVVELETDEEASNSSTELSTETKNETVEANAGSSVSLQHGTQDLSNLIQAQYTKETSTMTQEESNSNQQTIDVEQASLSSSSSSRSDATSRIYDVIDNNSGSGTDTGEQPNWDETQKNKSTFVEGSFGENIASAVAAGQAEKWTKTTSVTADEGQGDSSSASDADLIQEEKDASEVDKGTLEEARTQGENINANAAEGSLSS